MDVGGFMFAVGGGCCVLPVLLVDDPHAVIASTATAANAPNFMAFLPSLLEHKRMVGRPGQPLRPAFEFLGVAQGVHILTYRHELLAPIEMDHVARVHTDVDHLLDSTWLHGHAWICMLAFGEHANLLRADDKADAVAREDVRDPDEAGHELGGRSLVDVDRGTDLLDLAVRKDGEPVAHGQRLLLVG